MATNTKDELIERIIGKLEESNENVSKIKNFIESEITQKKEYLYEQYLNLIKKKDLKSISITDEEISYFDDVIKQNDDFLNQSENLAFLDDVKNYHEEILQKIKDTDKNSKNYLNLINENILTDNIISDVISRINSYFTFVKQIEDKIEGKIDITNFFLNMKGNIKSILDVLIDRLKKIKDGYINKLIYLRNFIYFNNSDGNFVVIGANGSGKSTFARMAKNELRINDVTIIPAQKIFNYNPINHIPITSNFLNELNNFQKQDRLSKDLLPNINAFTQDLDLIIKVFIEIDMSAKNEYYNYAQKSEDNIEKPKKNDIDTILCIWNSIIKHRKLKYSNYNLIVEYGTKEYDFRLLSDGEKAVFLFIASVIFSKKDSYIIIDEPENHLNLAIVNELWDKLEKERADCQFIYLTHNLEFACSRNNSIKLWSKKFIPPKKWEIETIPQIDKIPEKLFMSLLGSRKKILFCEGKKEGLDYKLYTLLFPNYLVEPVGGHLEVINHTISFNGLKDITGNCSIGIIDGDFHIKEQIRKWKDKNIFAIPVQEVENLLCDEIILTGVPNWLCDERGELINKTKKKMFEILSDENEIEKQVTMYISSFINNKIKGNLLNNKSQKINDLKNEFEKLIGEIDIDRLAEERKELFNCVIKEKDYDLALKIYNNKGFSYKINSKNIKKYPEMIIRYLGSEECPDDIIERFKKKYFIEIPDC